MSDKNHVFKMKTPNGWEVELQGDKDYVQGIYGDIKAGAVKMFNREAAATSREEALDKLLGESSSATASTEPAHDITLALPAVTESSAQEITKPTPAQAGSQKKKYKKTGKAVSSVRQERKDKISQIIQAKTFDDFERYNAAITRDGASREDQITLVTRLAQDKFGFETGLSPAEVQFVLKERFYINLKNRTVEETMKAQPGTFFAAAPADFDSRAKLYRPMKDCITRANELLAEFDGVKLGAGESVGGATTESGSVN